MVEMGVFRLWGDAQVKLNEQTLISMSFYDPFLILQYYEYKSIFFFFFWLFQGAGKINCQFQSIAFVMESDIFFSSGKVGMFVHSISTFPFDLNKG
jgi:hypothetical protein